MRYPLTHKFLVWAGPTLVVSIGGCIGLIAALTPSFPKLGPWAEHLFDQLWPIVTAPSSIVVTAMVLVVYAGALIFTAQPSRVKKTGLLAVKPMSRRERKVDEELRRRLADASPDEARRLLANAMEQLRFPRKPWFRRLWSWAGHSGGAEPTAHGNRRGLAGPTPKSSPVTAGGKRQAASSAAFGSWIQLDEAIRYLGKRSKWAGTRSQSDPRFSIDVGQQLQDALTCGDLSARGRKFHVLQGGIKDPPLHSLMPIPTGFWEEGRIHAYWALEGRVQNIASGRGESAVRNGEYEGMHDIRLNRSEVESLWPPQDEEADEAAFREAFDEIASDRIPFIRLRDLCGSFGIPLERFGSAQNNGYAVEGALKEAAANGLLAVWGRPYHGPVKDNDPLISIPADHFLKYSFRHGNLEYEAENHQSGTATMDMLVQGLPGIEGLTYYDLYLSLRQTKNVLRSLKARLIAG